MNNSTINTETKILGRFHTDDNGTGLNIYNPYFRAEGINAVYLLFRNQRPAPLLDGMRSLNVSGAITAGFEHDGRLAELVDEMSEAATLANRVGIVINTAGTIRGHYQGGEGLLSAISEKLSIANKRVVMVGAGTVVKTLLLAISQSGDRPSSIAICNRTVANAATLPDFPNLTITVHPLEHLLNLQGDILINASRIGSSVENNVYTPELVETYEAVADVTFGNPNTELISMAKDKGLTVIDGWDMFTHQAAVVLRECLHHEANISVLRQFVAAGLSETNHGATLK